MIEWFSRPRLAVFLADAIRFIERGIFALGAFQRQDFSQAKRTLGAVGIVESFEVLVVCIHGFFWELPLRIQDFCLFYAALHN
jgi:hypothetical protein